MKTARYEDLARRHGLAGPPEDLEHQTRWERDLLSAAQHQVSEAEKVRLLAGDLTRAVERITAHVDQHESPPVKKAGKDDEVDEDPMDPLLRLLGERFSYFMQAACSYDASLRETTIVGEHYRLQKGSQ